MFLTVNGMDWQVLKVKSTSRLLCRSDGTLALGATDSNALCVFLSSALKGELLYKVLCHELCHVYIFSYGYYLGLAEEERLAQFIAVYGRAIMGDTDAVLSLLETDRKGASADAVNQYA